MKPSAQKAGTASSLAKAQDRSRRGFSGQCASAGRQLELPVAKSWGGRRSGAGRKPKAGRRFVAHRARPAHRATHPVHVTLRYRVRSLRQQFVFPMVARSIAEANRCWNERFRIVHYSVQADHLHLIVEAKDRDTLGRALRGFSVRLARNVNQLLSRRGALSADRWHGRALTTPRAVRHALVYVLANFRKHERVRRTALDPRSSAPYFAGFVEWPGRAPAELDVRLAARELRVTGPPNVPAQTWLLRHGWLRHGLIGSFESPAPARA